MRISIKTSAVLPLLILGLIFAQAAGAEVVNYNTGLYHWVKTCTNDDGGWNQEYVGATSCPPYVVLPPNCTCNLTPYSFPVNNPYPYLVVQVGVPTDGNGKPIPGTATVTLDTSKAIECGIFVNPPKSGQGICGPAWTIVAADPATIDPSVIKLVEGLDYQDTVGVPVTSFNWFWTQPQQ
jgi:hypothetical protein